MRCCSSLQPSQVFPLFCQPPAEFWMEFSVFVFREVSASCMWWPEDLKALTSSLFLAVLVLQQTLSRPCSKPVWCNKHLLRAVGPRTWEQRTKQTLVWVCFFAIYINTQHQVVCVLTSHPLWSCCPTLPANVHFLKNIPNIARWDKNRWDYCWDPCCRVDGRASPGWGALFALCDALVSTGIPTRRHFILYSVFQLGLAIGWRGCVKSLLHLPGSGWKLDV